jgi:hypothetical protein
LTTSLAMAKPMPTLPPDGEDRRVDADHLALGVKGRAAGIAVVNRRVDLQEVVIGSGADVAPSRRDDAGGHCSAEAERVADRDHPIADTRRVRSERDIGEIGALSLQKRKVGFRVDADHLGGHRLAVGGRDRHFRGVIDDVVIGDNVAVTRNEESRPLSLREMMPRRTVAAIGAVIVIPWRAEVPEEMIERAVLGNIGHSRHSLRVFVIDLVGVAELDLDRNDGRLHAVNDIGERGRSSRGLRARGGGGNGCDRGFESDAAKGR